MPPKARACLTPRNKNAEDQRGRVRLGREDERPIRKRKNGPTIGLACNAVTFNEDQVDPRLLQHSCGELSTVCLHCKAIRWPGERSTFCCQNGKVKIEIPPPLPLDL